MAKQICPVCNESKIGFLNSEKVLDGKICEKCLNKIGLKTASMANEDIIKFENLDIKKVSSMIENDEVFDYKEEKEKIKTEKNSVKKEYQDLVSSFKENSSATWDDGVLFDSKGKRFLFKKKLTREEKLELFTNLASIEPVFRTNTKDKHHGVTRGVVGGLTFGVAGAVVGASTGHKNYSVISKMSVIMRFSDNYTFEMKLINSDMKVGMITNSLEKKFNTYITILDNIIRENSEQESHGESKPSLSIADEIKKLSDLKEQGILTQEEFNKQKEKLLG